MDYLFGPGAGEASDPMFYMLPPAYALMIVDDNTSLGQQNPAHP